MNYYRLLSIPPNANILEVLRQYQIKCLNNPQNIFLYTKGLQILTNSKIRLFYDINLFEINNFTLPKYLSNYNEYTNIDEYELLPFIMWLNNFKEAFYDTKYFTSNKEYHILIENWYDTLSQIIEHLKSYIETFYLT